MSEEQGKALATSTPESQAIAQIRSTGAAEVAHRREVAKIFKQMEGIKFGSVHGSSLSVGVRGAIAEFCETTGANVLTQVDILGGKPYLNANYWSDNLAQQPLFHHYEQRDLSPSLEDTLRSRAKRARNQADALEGHDKSAVLRKAFELEEEADEIAMDRQKWGARETATHVTETTIYRFINAAPIEKIQAGEITDLDPWLVTVKECNWAGGMGQTMAESKKWDPIGDANPGTTSRTRSLRRCAAKAFSAWMTSHEERIEKAEKMIEAEFEVLVAENEERLSNLPANGAPQTVSFGNGEPEVGHASAGESLPVEGEDFGVEATPIENEAPESEPEPEAPPFDANDARKALFATLRDAGVKNEDRKDWAKAHDLPASTSKWGKAEYDRAMGILIDPTRDTVIAGCQALELDLEDLSLRLLEKRQPAYLKDWQKLAGFIEDEMDGGDL